LLAENVKYIVIAELAALVTVKLKAPVLPGVRVIEFGVGPLIPKAAEMLNRPCEGNC